MQRMHSNKVKKNPSTAVSNGKPLRLLIVEDSEDDCLLLVRELTRAGYNPHYIRVDNKNDLSAALKNSEWDIVIADHRLPQFSSDGALETVKENAMDIPVIIVSGNIGEEIAVRVMRQGAQDYVMKGNLTRLVPAIEREIREAEFRRSSRYRDSHDQITGLCNRGQFEIRMQKAIDTAVSGDVAHALLYIDLDQFKVINDTCGHSAGDELLRKLTEDLKKQIRGRDTFSRLGGDEFGVLLEGCPLAKAREIADKILEHIKQFRFLYGGNKYAISASIGLVIIADATLNTHQLMSAADIACYAAKDLGRNRVHIYSKDDISLRQRHRDMQWVTEINRALETNSLFLEKQEIVSVRALGQAGMGNELLVRMHRDDGTVALPSLFIRAAERYNIMPAIDRWVINRTFEYIASVDPQKRCALYFINLSGNSLNDKSTYPYIRERRQHFNIPAELICFEITETQAIEHIETAQGFIREIKSEGFSFALDDFGAGISSYTYLKKLPVDFIKIDGSFIVDLMQDPLNYEIVNSIVRIGHKKGAQIIAEWVEDINMIPLLEEIGVDFVQGFGIHKPELL